LRADIDATETLALLFASFFGCFGCFSNRYYNCLVMVSDSKSGSKSSEYVDSSPFRRFRNYFMFICTESRTHLQLPTLSAIFSHGFRAKFTASAML
jgi:hypothetical protein